MQLNDDDVQLILKELLLPEVLKKMLVTLTNSRTPISNQLAEKLRDLCTEKLASHGFDEKYQPTHLGKRLEEIIDKLYRP